MVKGRGRSIPPLVIVAGTQTTAALAWLGYFVVTGHAFVSPRVAWPAIVFGAGLVLGMGALLARASARGDISVVGPVFALSPIFTILPDAVLSGTLPSPLGWIGLALAVFGTLNMGATQHRTPKPPLVAALTAVFKRRDALDALAAAVLLGFLAAVDRWGARMMGPPSYLVCSHGATAVLTWIIVVVTAPRAIARALTPQSAVTIVAHGLLGVTGTGMQTTALTLAPAAYVNAIRRMSAVIAVVLGARLFREPDMGRRLVAALLACAGAACLLLAR